MLGPYQTESDRLISYKGNKVFEPVKKINKVRPSVSELEARCKHLKQEEMWSHIARINHHIYKAANQYFDEVGALFTPLPLTTRMISSPGAVYAGNAIDYTSDTCPITLKWFDLPQVAFLSESSQIYLEIALMQRQVYHVYSIYNSFRKEEADVTHLPEFHHIEYEGKVSQSENQQIAFGLLAKIIKELLNHNEADLLFFLNSNKLYELEELSTNINKIPVISYAEALEILSLETKDSKYQVFTTSNNWGMWEEVRITEIYGKPVSVTQFPLLEVPFYHAEVAGAEPKVAENMDLIWSGYREILGSGHRIRSKEALEAKAKLFQLPKEDYIPYLQTREFADYEETSGFGLGWERLVQGLLETPYIWSTVHFPRINDTLKP